MMAVNAPLELRYTSMLSAFRSIVTTEGVRSLWRGMPVVFTCAGPAHGAYFAAYEAVKRQTGARLGRDNPIGHSKCHVFFIGIFSFSLQNDLPHILYKSYNIIFSFSLQNDIPHILYKSYNITFEFQ